jgi:integrase
MNAARIRDDAHPPRAKQLGTGLAEDVCKIHEVSEAPAAPTPIVDTPGEAHADRSQVQYHPVIGRISEALAPVPPERSSAIVVRAPELSAEEVEGLASDARAANTRRAYASDCRAFVDWCNREGYDAIPAAPATLVRYVSYLERLGRKAATIGRALAAISVAHQARDIASPTSHRLVRNALKGMRRRIGTAPVQKAPVLGEDLGALLGTFGVDLPGLRNRAMVTLGWFGALRRSELVALDVPDVAFVAEGLVLTLRRSKTDQEGKGAEKGIPFAKDQARCAVRAVRAYLDAARLEAGALFRSVSRTGQLGPRLSDRAVARLVQTAARRAGLDARRFGGHSLRAGFATTAARKGKSLDAIMKQTGHRSERVARGYIRHATLFQGNAAKGLA